MTINDIELLCTSRAMEVIEERLGDDPLRVAADKHLAAEFGAGTAAIATQIKYLQRARAKLPSWFAARCVIPPRAFEQASGEATAAHKRYGGGHCVDLTCGLGVDGAALARSFESVTSVERDPVLAAAARVNFARLGLRNIEVVNSSAEEFLAGEGPKADMIYVDPDRRDHSNRKLVLLQDCAPDVVALHGRMHEIAPKVVVKCSPLFDAPEAFRLFGPRTLVEAVSVGGECRELLIETGGHIPHPTLRASIAGGETFQSDGDRTPLPPPPPMAESYRYLLLPDVSLRKLRLSREYLAPRGAWIASESGYAFADSPPGEGMFRAMEIECIEEYNPRAMKRRLAGQGTTQLRIMRRDFPVENAAIARALGVREGGERTVAFTRTQGRRIAVFLK